MKNILLIISLFALPGLCLSQNRAINKFYRQHKHDAGVTKAKLPGWVVRVGGKIAKVSSDSKEEKNALNLTRKFGKVKFMYSEEGTKISPKAVENLRQGLLRQNFDDLILIKDANMNLQIMVEDVDDKVRSILMFYNDGEDGEMFFLSARTNISYKDLKQLIEENMKEQLEPVFDIEEEDQPVETTL